MKAMNPPPITATPPKPMVGRIADTVKAKPLVGEAIALEMLRSKKEPRMIPMIAVPQATSKGILIFFIAETLYPYRIDEGIVPKRASIK